MARTLPKEKLLPSLLDRLTDDDPVNRSLQQVRTKVNTLEKKLVALKNTATLKKPAEFRQQRDLIRQDLDANRLQYATLSASVSSLKEIRECVKRDLDWLFNSHNYYPQEDLNSFPEVGQSVLNFGLPDLAGSTASGVDVRDMEKLLKRAILDFEPRIIRRTLNVKLMVDESRFDHNALTFEIEGELIAEPFPLHLHLRTQLELENGDMTVQEFDQ